MAVATTAIWLSVCPAANAQTAPVRYEAAPELDRNGRAKPVERARLTNIDRTAASGSVRVTLEFDREVEYYTERIGGPARVYFDLRNAQLTPELANKVLTYPSDVVKKIRVGRHPELVRVVLDVEDASTHSVSTLDSPFRLVIDVQRAAARAVEKVAPLPSSAPPIAPSLDARGTPIVPAAVPPITAAESSPPSPASAWLAMAAEGSEAPRPLPLQSPGPPLFRVFLSDGRVLSSYGEWARVQDRVVFSMPTRLSREPMELHLMTIPSQRVDWPRTEMYAESVRAAAYAAHRGDADFAAFTSEVAKTLNAVSKISDPRERLATAERARQKLADWPAAHYGYRIEEVREALNVLDEVTAQLRVGVGITRFDLTLSAPLPAPPPPPLPPPSDAELMEQFMAAASISESPAERMSLLQTVLRMLDRAVGLLPKEWADRIRGTVSSDLDREREIQRAYDALQTSTLEAAEKLAARGKMSDLEKLRDKVRAEDQRLGGQRAGDVAALLATIDLETAVAIESREATKVWQRRAPVYRRYRRAMNNSFKTFNEAIAPLEHVKAMSGPPVNTIEPLAKQLARSSKTVANVAAPEELAPTHALIRSAWELADSAFRLRLESVARNSIDVAQRASSAAAGALMLYQRARADQLSAMEPPARK